MCIDMYVTILVKKDTEEGVPEFTSKNGERMDSLVNSCIGNLESTRMSECRETHVCVTMWNENKLIILSH